MSLNPISELNELAQRLGGTTPLYSTSRTGGVDHAPEFSCEVSLAGKTARVHGFSSTFMAKRHAAQHWLRIHGAERGVGQWDARRGPSPTRLATPDSFGTGGSLGIGGKYAAPRYQAAPPPAALPTPEAVAPIPTPAATAPIPPPASSSTTVHIDAENRAGDLEAAAAAATGGLRVVAYAASKWPGLAAHRARYPQFDWQVTSSGVRDAADVLLIVQVVRALGWPGGGRHVVVGADTIYFALADVARQLWPEAPLAHAATWADAALR